MLRGTTVSGLAAILLLGCEEKVTEVEVSDTRELTSEDEKTPRLDMTSGERFEGGRPIVPQPAPVEPEEIEDPQPASTPEGWTPVAGTSIRLMNFTFGPDGEGEVYLSRSMGGIPANVVRWARQFAKQVDENYVPGLPKATLGGAEGVFVELEGTYSPGFGRPAKEGQRLLGIVAERGQEIWTLKMTGPAELVAADKARLTSFAESVELPE